MYFNYTVRINITGGDNYSLSYDVESHAKPNITLKNLSECQQVDISVSLPGTCEAKTISGLLPIGMNKDTVVSLTAEKHFFPHYSSSTIPVQCFQ